MPKSSTWWKSEESRIKFTWKTNYQDYSKALQISFKISFETHLNKYRSVKQHLHSISSLKSDIWLNKLPNKILNNFHISLRFSFHPSIQRVDFPKKTLKMNFAVAFLKLISWKNYNEIENLSWKLIDEIISRKGWEFEI